MDVGTPEYMRHVRALSEDIGPRGSTTAGERRAAEYVAAELRAAGGEVALEPFRSHTSFSHAYGLIYLLGLLGAAALWYNAGLALAVGGAAALLFWGDNNARFSVGRVLPQRPSQNVVARFPARTPPDASGEPRRTVVLLAHYDTARSALMFEPKQVRYFRQTFLASAVALFAVPVLAVLSMAVNSQRVLALLGLPSAAYLAFGVALLAHREIFGRYTPGANDNASGVSVLLGTAEELGRQPLESTEVWAVATGCEEVGLVGMTALVKAHGEELRPALFINLDNLGTGRPKYTTGEGMLGVSPCDDRLVAVAQRVARTHPEWGVQGVPNTIMLTDAQVALSRGLRVISLRAEDERRRLPNWHWHTDVAANVEPGTLAVVGGFLREMLEQIDAGAAD